MGEAPNSVPVLVFKTGRYAIHHSALGIIRSLGRMGVPVYAVVENRLTPAAVSRYLTKKIVWDDRDCSREQLLEGLDKIGKQIGRPSILIPTDDFAAILIAEEAVRLRRWFIFPELDPSLPQTLASKKNLYQLCRDMNVPHPNAVFPNSISDVHEFLKEATMPVVVKIDAGWLNTTRAPSVRIVSSAEELIAIFRQTPTDLIPNLLVQEYIADGEDWFFHGYCNAQSDCLAAFTGRKLRSYPPDAGSTVLGKSVTNSALCVQTEALLKAIRYTGIMDIDFRFDRRDAQYKMLDFNPRIGAQFRLFEDRERNDVARVCYRDLTRQPGSRSSQVDGRVFILEFDDLRASLQGLRKHELAFSDWWRSFKGTKEFAWWKWNDPAPFLLVFLLTIIKIITKFGRLVVRASAR